MIAFIYIFCMGVVLNIWASDEALIVKVLSLIFSSLIFSYGAARKANKKTRFIALTSSTLGLIGLLIYIG